MDANGDQINMARPTPSGGKDPWHGARGVFGSALRARVRAQGGVKSVL